MWNMAPPSQWRWREVRRRQNSRRTWRAGFPDDTEVRYAYLPEIRALLALNQDEPARAIELLRIAVPYELGAPMSSTFGFFGSLYPVYVRGIGYLAAR
jgi:hypothetical protein